jgi:hypothetical protein
MTSMTYKKLFLSGPNLENAKITSTRFNSGAGGQSQGGVQDD